MKQPELLTNPDFKHLIATCKQYIEKVESGYVDEDTEHYIFEAAIEALYGPEVWIYIREKL